MLAWKRAQPFDLSCTSLVIRCRLIFSFFFFNDTATTEIYTLSLHDALPISRRPQLALACRCARRCRRQRGWRLDRKSTRLNSSHTVISYAVFCLKKKKKTVKSDEDVRQEDCRIRTLSEHDGL